MFLLKFALNFLIPSSAGRSLSSRIKPEFFFFVGLLAEPKIYFVFRFLRPIIALKIAAPNYSLLLSEQVEKLTENARHHDRSQSTH